MFMIIYGGHVWSRMNSYMGRPTLYEWGAVRKFKSLPADVSRAFDGCERHWRAFAGPGGHVMGKGYITKIILNSDESGSYEFTGVGMPIVLGLHDSH